MERERNTASSHNTVNRTGERLVRMYRARYEKYTAHVSNQPSDESLYPTGEARQTAILVQQ